MNDTFTSVGMVNGTALGKAKRALAGNHPAIRALRAIEDRAMSMSPTRRALNRVRWAWSLLPLLEVRKWLNAPHVS